MILTPRHAALFALFLLSGPTLAHAQGADAPPGRQDDRRAPSAPVATPAASAPPRAPQGNGAGRVAAESDAAAKAMQADLEPQPGGLTADEVVRLALEHSPNLAKAELELDKAAANEARSKLAFVPRIDLTASYTRLSLFEPPCLARDASGVCQAQFPVLANSYQTAARTSLPITDMFLTVIPTYKGVKQLAKVSEHQRDAQKLQVSYDARVAFYEYARLRGREAVARASTRVREAGVRDLEALVAAGTATQTELVRAQAELANAQVQAIQAAGGVEVARERLEQLTGVEVDPKRGIGEPFVEIDIGDTPAFPHVLSTARASRPELLALQSLEEGRTNLLRARRGAELPKLEATAGVLRGRPNQRFVPQKDEWRTTWDVGVAVKWSPNDAIYAHTQANDAETDLATVRQDRRLIEQGIAVEAVSAVT
jgi:outer membrane protein